MRRTSSRSRSITRRREDEQTAIVRDVVKVPRMFRGGYLAVEPFFVPRQRDARLSEVQRELAGFVPGFGAGRIRAHACARPRTVRTSICPSMWSRKRAIQLRKFDDDMAGTGRATLSGICRAGTFVPAVLRRATACERDVNRTRRSRRLLPALRNCLPQQPRAPPGLTPPPPCADRSCARPASRPCRAGGTPRARPSGRAACARRRATSVVCLSTLAMRRATTCAVTRSVSVNAIRIEPSSSRQAMSLARSSRPVMRAASRLARRLSSVSKESRASDRPAPRASAVAATRCSSLHERVVRHQAGFGRERCPSGRATRRGA